MYPKQSNEGTSHSHEYRGSQAKKFWLHIGGWYDETTRLREILGLFSIFDVASPEIYFSRSVSQNSFSRIVPNLKKIEILDTGLSIKICGEFCRKQGILNMDFRKFVTSLTLPCSRSSKDYVRTQDAISYLQKTAISSSEKFSEVGSKP